MVINNVMGYNMALNLLTAMRIQPYTEVKANSCEKEDYPISLENVFDLQKTGWLFVTPEYSDDWEDNSKIHALIGNGVCPPRIAFSLNACFGKSEGLDYIQVNFVGGFYWFFPSDFKAACDSKQLFLSASFNPVTGKYSLHNENRTFSFFYECEIESS